jgi:hypothetical protein
VEHRPFAAPGEDQAAVGRGEEIDPLVAHDLGDHFGARSVEVQGERTEAASGASMANSSAASVMVMLTFSLSTRGVVGSQLAVRRC